MSTHLETLQTDLRKVEAHLAVFPNDSYAKAKLVLIEGGIEMILSKPAIRVSLCAVCPSPHSGACITRSHAKLPPLTRSVEWVETTTYSDPKSNPAPWAFPKGENWVCPKPPEPLPVANLEALRYTFGPFEGMHEKTKKALNAEANAPRFTFGADYEMDERWLAAEREKANNGYNTVSSREVFSAEPDKMMFPTMAFNLTSWDNVKYGTKNY